ncbi:unnamed protein product, partial [Didymodactylos carnosus]
NKIRQAAREGQKRQADEFLQRTAKKQKLANFNVGDNVVSVLIRAVGVPLCLY